jgi:hypothetical protein
MTDQRERDSDAAQALYKEALDWATENAGNEWEIEPVADGYRGGVLAERTRIIKILEDWIAQYPEDVFVSKDTPDGIAAHTLRRILPSIIEDIK